MKTSIYFLILCSICISCKKPVCKIPENNIAKKSVEYEIKRRLISSYFDVGENLEYHDMVGSIDTVRVTKIIYPGKEIFIYSNGHKSDTLIRSDDSYTYNSFKLQFISSKIISFNKSQVKVLKFKYDEKNKFYPADIYLNDSIGIIIHQLVSQWRAIHEFDIQNSELHKAIINDSVFFTFEN